MKTSVAFKLISILKNSKATIHRETGKNKYDRKLTELDFVTTDLNYWIKHPFEFSDPILKPEYL